jgi:hypothetical protein
MMIDQGSYTKGLVRTSMMIEKMKINKNLCLSKIDQIKATKYVITF